MVAGVVTGINGWHEKDRFSPSCTVNVAHSFARGISAGILMSCLCVVCCDGGTVFPFFSASMLLWTCSGVHLSAVCTFECPLFVVLALVGVMSSCVIYAGLDFRPAGPGMVADLLVIELLRHFHKGPHSEVPVPSCNSGG